MLHVTHMSELPDIAIWTQKKKNWLTKSPRNSTFIQLLLTSRSMSLPSWCDWLTVCLSSCQTKTPTAMCRPTLNFFPLSLFFFIFHFLFSWRFLVSLFWMFAFFSLFPFDMLNENEIITSHFFLWLMGDSNVLILFTQRQNANITTQAMWMRVAWVFDGYLDKKNRRKRKGIRI